MKPPKLARQLFTWYCGAAMVDDLLGDMEEIFDRNLTRMPAWRAKALYWRQVSSLMTSYAISKRRQRASLHPHSNDSINFHMIKNYFLIAWRMMTRNKVYTTINVLGLTLGISACIIVYLVVSFQMSFDKFHPGYERIYRIHTIDTVNHQDVPCMPLPGFIAIHDEFAGAEALMGYYVYDAKVAVENKHFDRIPGSIILTYPDYFNVFQYQWLAGKPDVFAKPMQVVLTESRARTYFGPLELHEILGKTVIYNDSLSVSVAGIVKDWTGNSDFKRTEFISFSTIENSFLRKLVPVDNWNELRSAQQSFIKLKPGDDPVKVAAEVSKINPKHGGRAFIYRFEKLSDIHFATVVGDQGAIGLLPALYALIGLSAFILIIAAINFINLSTAQSINRGREIGIRKVMGSLKRQIVVQFLSETLVLGIISLVLSIALTRPLLFLFSDFIPWGVSFDPLAINTWLFFGALLLVISLLAGLYPALVMSSYLPAITLSGKRMSRGREKFSLRKTLIVLQFSASLFFIIATLVIGGQMNLIRNSDRGFSTEGVITFRTPWQEEPGKTRTLVERLRNISELDEVTMQGFPPMGFAQMKNTLQYSGKNGPVEQDVAIKPGDQHYISTYKLRIVAGRDIKESDTVEEVVINEALAKALGFDDVHEAIGEHLQMNGHNLPIVGIVRDFHQLSFRQPIDICLISHIPVMEHGVAVRLQNPDIVANAGVMAKIESEYKQLFPDEPFDYHFIEDEIGWLHDGEQKTSKLATIAMGITIFISCMGVFGLAMFTANMRTREIGIRKVLGATSISIMNMLSREFMLLIIVSVVLATPVAWYYMNNWLSEFTYRVDLSWWFFVAAAAIALITGLITVSFQSFKAATGNPIEALRSE